MHVTERIMRTIVTTRPVHDQSFSGVRSLLQGNGRTFLPKDRNVLPIAPKKPYFDCRWVEMIGKLNGFSSLAKQRYIYENYYCSKNVLFCHRLLLFSVQIIYVIWDLIYLLTIKVI
jgi:hypothetical protein